MLTAADGFRLPGFTDLTVIGRGGFSRVYRAHQEQFARDVAIKVLDIDTLDERGQRRFIRECQATGRLASHPFIVSVFDAGVAPTSNPYIVMEFCSGGSLASRLLSQGPLPVTDVIDIGRKMCDALAAAHALSIMHRDVKPANILVTNYGEPALADFGIAFATDSSRSVGTEALTVDYAPPEVLEGDEPDARSDLYSLGVTLYTLLTGRAPYNTGPRAPLAQQLLRILRDPVPMVERKDVGVGLRDLIGSLMAKQPDERPLTAALASSMFADLAHSHGQTIARPVDVLPLADDLTVVRPPARSSVAPLLPPLATPIDAAADATTLRDPIPADRVAEPPSGTTARDTQRGPSPNPNPAVDGESASADSELTFQKPKDLEAKAASVETTPEGTAPTSDQITTVGKVRRVGKPEALALALACFVVAGAGALTLLGSSAPGPATRGGAKDMTPTKAAAAQAGYAINLTVTDLPSGFKSGASASLNASDKTARDKFLTCIGSTPVAQEIGKTESPELTVGEDLTGRSIQSFVAAVPTLSIAARDVAAFTAAKARTCLVDYLATSGPDVRSAIQEVTRLLTPRSGTDGAFGYSARVALSSQGKTSTFYLTIQDLFVKHLHVSLVTASIGSAFPSEVREKALATLIQRTKDAAV